MSPRKYLPIILGLLGLGFILLIGWVASPWPAAYPLKRQADSTLLYDAQGFELRELYFQDGASGRWLPLDSLPSHLVEAVLLAEDRRFYYHWGLDPLAIGRSIYHNLRSGQILMGGSTIHQQLVRSLLPLGEPGWKRKFLEALWALRLSFNFSHEQILEAYLNRLYWGRQAYGIQAASERYFDCPAANLSPAQGAWLAVLIRAPRLLDSPSERPLARRLQAQILDSLHRQGRLDDQQWRFALSEPLRLAPWHEPWRAPHFSDYVAQELERLGYGGCSAVYTTLQGAVQREVERLAAYHLERLAGKGVGNCSVVVAERQSGKIVALLGSRDYFDSQGGQNNGALALRQPGSTLKPFTYALALNSGFTPASILPDLPYLEGMLTDSFVPQNYDRQWHGPLRLRRALACSYNIPAVYLLEQIGIERLLNTLRQLGMSDLRFSASYYGLGLTLGAGEVSLVQLVNAYRTLANGGRYTPLRAIESVQQEENRLAPPLTPARTVLEAGSCALINDILSDSAARLEAFGYSNALHLPFTCAVKTGTSKGFRDNWCLGFGKKYVVGVWVGNFDGRPMRHVSGVSGAAPLWRDIMLYLESRLPPAASGESWPFNKQGLCTLAICPQSGQRPGPYCAGRIAELFLPQNLPTATCEVHRAFACDKESGQFVDPATAPPASWRARVYPLYGTLYYAWMRERGLTIPPLWAQIGREDKKPTTQQPTKPQILFPESEAVFKLDPILRAPYQRLTLRAWAPEGWKQLYWQVDGQSLPATPPPFTNYWTLQRGTHQLTLHATPQGPALDRRTFSVF